MQWYRFEAGVLTHPKTAKLAEMLAVSKVECVGILATFWSGVALQAEDGDLSHWSNTYLREITSYAGTADMLKCLIECGFIDKDMQCHNWLLRNAYTLKERIRKSEERKAKKEDAVRGRGADCPRTERGQNADAARPLPTYLPTDIQTHTQEPEKSACVCVSKKSELHWGEKAQEVEQYIIHLSPIAKQPIHMEAFVDCLNQIKNPEHVKTILEKFLIARNPVKNNGPPKANELKQYMAEHVDAIRKMVLGDKGQ